MRSLAFIIMGEYCANCGEHMGDFSKKLVNLEGKSARYAKAEYCKKCWQVKQRTKWQEDFAYAGFNVIKGLEDYQCKAQIMKDAEARKMATELKQVLDECVGQIMNGDFTKGTKKGQAKGKAQGCVNQTKGKAQGCVNQNWGKGHHGTSSASQGQGHPGYAAGPFPFPFPFQAKGKATQNKGGKGKIALW